MENFTLLCDSPDSPYNSEGLSSGVDSYIPSCQFPYVNRGYLDANLWIDNDCSMLWSSVTDELAGYGQYNVKRLVYLIPMALTFVLNCHSYYIVRMNRIARGGKSMNFAEYGQLGFIGVELPMMIFFLDIDQTSGIISIHFSNVLMGIALTSLMATLHMFVEKWVAILDSKGKVQVAPKWLTMLRHFSTFMMFVGEVIIANVEQIVTSPAKDVNGAYSAKMNSIKNIYIGLQIMVWSGIAINYGTGIKKRLAKASKEIGPETIKIGKICKGIFASCFAGCAYKFAFGFLRLGKHVIYMDPPCGAGWVNILGALMTFICAICTLAQLPKVAKVGKVNPSTTRKSSMSSQGQ